MDTLFEGLSFSMNGFNFIQDSGFNFNQESTSIRSNQNSPNNPTTTSHEITQTPNLPTPRDQPNDPFNTTLKFIGEMLMEEEDLERKSVMLKDSLALQAAEKSFYDALCQNCPSFVIQKNTGKSESKPEYESECSSFQTSASGSSMDTFLVHDSSCEVQSVANKLRGKTGEVSQIVDLGKIGQNLLGVQQSRKKPRRRRECSDYDDLEEGRRSYKQSAVFSVDDSEPREIFDVVLLSDDDSDEPDCLQKTAQPNEQAKGYGKTKRVNKLEQTVDLWTLSIQCAQAVVNDDRRNASQLLKQIRQHSSPCGDATQRLAHYFANGLEARLTGTKTPSYSSLVNNELSSSDILKAYQLFITASPFCRMSFCFANSTIRKLAQNAERIHIIDFGILYGFQWPGLIQRLSQRPGGPPKLRVTGIELPERGFRPAEKVEETKRRLASYCDRFNVPSEYHVIAQRWDTIRYEDLKIESGEVVVVNCLHRMRHVPDEPVGTRTPRDTVLNLIRRINPELFIHGVVNANYNGPCFATRFKEALFHFSGLFDMFDATVPREDEYRVKFEKAIYGRDIVNVVACEGLERVDRPESYMKWQARNIKAGLRQVPLDKEICEAVKETVRSSYNKDFLVEQDGQWLLQGWKGRPIYALSCWKPA